MSSKVQSYITRNTKRNTNVRGITYFFFIRVVLRPFDRLVVRKGHIRITIIAQGGCLARVEVHVTRPLGSGYRGSRRRHVRVAAIA